MRIARAAFRLACLGVVLTLVGCQSDNTAQLDGTVKLAGEPLDKGSIAFAPADGQGQTAGGEITNGKYSVKVPVGIMKVEIRYPKVVGKKKDYDAPGGKYYDLYEESLPPKYNDETTLTVKVQRGKNQKDWDLGK